MNRTLTFLTTLFGLLIMVQSASAQQYDVAFKSLAGHFVVAEDGGGGAVNANRHEMGPWERFTLIDLNGGKLVSGDVVNLKSATGLYVVAENGGGSVVKADRTAAGAWEKFTITRLVGDGPVRNGDTIVLQASNGQYVVVENGGGGVLNANRKEIGPWEKFTILINGNGCQ